MEFVYVLKNEREYWPVKLTDFHFGGQQKLDVFYAVPWEFKGYMLVNK